MGDETAETATLTAHKTRRLIRGNSAITVLGHRDVAGFNLLAALAAPVRLDHVPRKQKARETECSARKRV